MVVGAGMTFVVQSSSVFTSAITPLIGESQPCLVPAMCCSRPQKPIGANVLGGAGGAVPPWETVGMALVRSDGTG